jgi:cobalt-zinc-cadmium efflux system outer membrane protein
MDILRASTTLACLLLTTGAPAAETLTLGRALERVSTSNPSLAAQAAMSEAARSRAELQSLPPPLTLGTDIENVAGTGALRGFDSAETTVQVSRLIELGGKRAGRRALGAAEVAQADHALASARLDAIALTTRRFVEVVADQARLALATERVALAERTHQEVARVVRNARNPETDLRAAEIALAEAELGREHAEHELRAARVTLASTWGSLQPDFDDATLPLEVLVEPEPFETLAAKLAGSSVVRAVSLEAEAAQARQRLAAAEARPDLNVSLGVRRLEAFGEQGVVMSMSLPLGTGSRARLALAEGRADAAAIERRKQALAIDSQQVLFERYQELGHALNEFAALNDVMIPKARAALDIATRGFDLGRFPFLTLAQAQETLFELRRRRIDAALDYHTLLAEMQRLVAAAEVP